MSSNPQSSDKQTKAGAAASSSPQQTKRARADANEADSKVLKKAKPSICKAAEELVCPILQGLPIDPVTAEDVSQGVCLCCCANPLCHSICTYLLTCCNVFTHCDFRAKFTSGRRLRSTFRRRGMPPSHQSPGRDSRARRSIQLSMCEIPSNI